MIDTAAQRGKFRRIKALIIKEFYQILRDPSSLVIATIFPLFLLFMYGFGVSLDLNQLRVGLILEDSGNDAMDFANALNSSPFFKVQTAKDPGHFYTDLTTAKLDAIVWVPFYFSDYWQRALSADPTEKAPIYVIADGSSPNTAAFAQNYILGAWGNWQNQLAVSSDIKPRAQVEIAPRFWFNEELNSHYFLVPGSIAIIMTLIGTLLTALMIAREWERGTMEALMATPVTIGEILWSKLIPYFFLGMISMSLCTLVGKYLFHVPFLGSFAALCLVTFCFLLVALATGLLISTMAKDQFTAAQISLVTAFLPAFILSGFIFEISSMPLPIRITTYLLPARYFVSSLQTLFLAGDVWPLILRSCLFLILFALGLMLIIASKTKKRLD